MNPTITVFKSSPDRGRGLARDMAVRWALEEVGQSYDVQLVTFQEMKEPAYRALQPFGQIPTYQSGELVLFESGAIVLHIAENSDGLLPSDPNARARTITWMFCALSTMEPPIVERSVCASFERDRSWHQERLALLDERVNVRLKELSVHLGESEYLEAEFSAGDLMMVAVLRRLGSTGLLERHTNICAYIDRAQSRPAFQRAFAAQLAVYSESLK